MEFGKQMFSEIKKGADFIGQQALKVIDYVKSEEFQNEVKEKSKATKLTVTNIYNNILKSETT